MNNPDKDRLLSFESHTDTKKPDVKMVWLLNLIPYTGAGYFYALGASKAIKPMIFIWIFMLIFGPGTLLPMYFILSALGTAHILNKNSATAKKLRQVTLGKDVGSVLPGQQIPMAQTSEYSLSTLETKAKRAAKTLKRIGAENDDAKSKHAFETFEYKAQAAEKMLKARNQASEPAPNVVPETSTESSDQQAFAQQQSDSSDYISQVNSSYSQADSSYSIDAEVDGITSRVARGTAADASEVSDFLNKADASNDADLKRAQFGESLKSSRDSEEAMTAMLDSADLTTSQIQAPNLVPDISSQVAPSASYIPEVTAQYSADPLPLPSGTMQNTSGSSSDPMSRVPEVSSQISSADFVLPVSSSFLVNSDQSIPEVSSQLVDSSQFTPDVNSQLVNSEQDAPDVSSQLVNSEQVAPDVSSQLVNSSQFTPDVSSQLVNSEQFAPDISSQLPDSSLSSLGNFEAPKFSFSFEDHMATPLVADVTPSATSAATASLCPKCGAAKDSNFSFCLACGQSFL